MVQSHSVLAIPSMHQSVFDQSVFEAPFGRNHHVRLHNSLTVSYSHRAQSSFSVGSDLTFAFLIGAAPSSSSPSSLCPLLRLVADLVALPSAAAFFLLLRGVAAVALAAVVGLLSGLSSSLPSLPPGFPNSFCCVGQHMFSDVTSHSIIVSMSRHF
jgi:hypothetical protein